MWLAMGKKKNKRQKSAKKARLKGTTTNHTLKTLGICQTVQIKLQELVKVRQTKRDLAQETETSG